MTIPAVSLRTLVYLLGGLGLAVGAIATVRLGMVVAATPTNFWFEAAPRLIELSEPANAGLESLAANVSKIVDDPALIRGRLADCRPPVGVEAANGDSRTLRNERCLAVVDTALRTSPALGELWLFKADRLLRAAQTGPAIEALRNSYATASREGWIAGGRVVLGLKLYPLLPADIQENVVADLHLVLRYPELAEPIVEAYRKNGPLRRAALSALQKLPPDLLEMFVATVRPAA